MSAKEENDNFVTVVAVGTDQQEPDSENINFESNGPGYVTVLTIGDTDNNNKVLKDVTEEVLVYRLPGERLGFGLKFEGGTKANEFVKRLFIQSCAADSPASRVKSSWGKLTEGDEVLEIDSIPVNTMTRIDCVRCLKDSNVAIKLLVRHIYDSYKKCEDEPPQVVSTEEKRTPPPPPPVPPRKIPRKLLKNANPVPKDTTDNSSQESTTPQRQIAESPGNNVKTKKLQSPRGSIKSYYSPNVPRRDRRFSDGSLGPPDAEVYVDLFLQESTQSLSESDDTGSTISTVIDRFGSFPTTTTSSFSGSLPSTPTSIQRQLDVSNITIYDDEDSTPVNKSLVKSLVQSKEENNNTIVNPVDEDSSSCFQDAPLSYGNESTKIIMLDDSEEVDEQASEQPEEIKQPVKKPPVPPRARDSVKNNDVAKDTKCRNENTDLPRLVDFVPKSSNGLKDNIESSTELMKLFLENERYKTNFTDFETDENDNLDTYTNGIDIYSSKWSLSSQLATIGEVEEEMGSEIGFSRSLTKTTPVVIVENADCANESEKIQCQNEALNNMSSKEADGKMATLPSDSRQPPDGHEFPDFIETNESIRRSQSYFEDNDKNNHSDTFSHKDTYRTTLEFPVRPTNLILCHSVSSSNTDLRPKMYDSTEDLKYSDLVAEPPTNLHTRSQSLIDMSALSKQKNTKWNMLMEQRRKGLSKLKGLVIPEASESEVLPSVSIPEIKSQNTTTFVPVQKLDNNISTQTFSSSYSDYSSKPSIPPWPITTSNNIPKYSPAFKRRSLQVYPTITKNGTTDYTSNEFIKYYDKTSSKTYKANEDDLNPPKSLESISSPTRSDCSFDYVSSTKRYIRDTFTKSLNGKEDESDNDSAVSSSQSSYNSRFSPPPSPTRSCDLNNYKSKTEDDDKLNTQNRLLKPSSVEAINRKNILASAKCRSGKDLKIGSPVIRRKQEEQQKAEEVEKRIGKEEAVPKPPEAGILDKVNDAFADVELISKQIEIKESTKPPSKVVEIEKIPQKPLPKSNFTPTKPPVCPVSSKSYAKDSKENKFPPISKTFDIRFRHSQPIKINVKALKENFENFGSKPPCPAVKIPTYKSQIVTKNVKAEIVKTENKIISNVETPIKKTEKVEIKPKETKIAKVEEKRVVEKVVVEKRDTKTIKLRLDSSGGSLGITLAGGTDYENKEITVHRIRYGSVAYHDGRLKRGDKIISVNGKITNNLTHDEAVELLKEPVMEFVIQMEEANEIVPSATSNLQRRSSSLSVLTDIKSPTVEVPAKKANNVVSFVKDGAGLGFSIEGGKDSPLGDVPLVVKKIFTGGAADKNGQLKVGDEIISINDTSFSNLSRMEAWTMMKKVPEGNVNIHIFR